MNPADLIHLPPQEIALELQQAAAQAGLYPPKSLTLESAITNPDKFMEEFRKWLEN